MQLVLTTRPYRPRLRRAGGSTGGARRATAVSNYGSESVADPACGRAGCDGRYVLPRALCGMVSPPRADRTPGLKSAPSYALVGIVTNVEVLRGLRIGSLVMIWTATGNNALKADTDHYDYWRRGFGC